MCETEAAYHLVFLAWLHRVVNSGGKIERYAVGLGRMDLHIQYGDDAFAIELKLQGKNALEEGMIQLTGYLQRLNLDTGYLILFQRGKVEDEQNIGRRETMMRDGKRLEVI